MDDALSVQISRVRHPGLRDALAALISASIDRLGEDPAAVRELAGTLAPVRSTAGPEAAVPRGAEPGDAVGRLLRSADSLTGPARLEALVRAGEAICALGDHFRYREVTSRAAGPRDGTAAPGDAPAGLVAFGGDSAGIVVSSGDAAGLVAFGGGSAGIPAAGGDPAGTAALLAQIDGFGALFDGRYAEAVAALRRVVAFAEHPVSGAAEVTGPVRGSAAALACGDDGAALRLAVRAEAAARAGGDPSLVPRALELKGAAELWRGAHDAAVSTSLAGVRAAAVAGRPDAADPHLATLALLAALRGDRAACRWRLAQVGAGAGRPRALGRWALGVLDLLAGRPHEAVARIGGIADPRSGRGHVLVQVMAAPDLVEAAVLAGDPGAARVALAAFDRWAESTGEPLRRALSARCHALLARRGSTEADAYFREALRLHLAGESEFARARTQLLFGRDLRRRRRPGQAREQLGAALDAFVRCGARPWAEQARAELRAGGGRVGPAGAAVPLTAQQLQIARLVASGATNREVAARLFLSPRTVDHHMRNIFHRLGISSRVALVKMIT
ncbi:DNA-binding CsgD family transcriptional regulator [Catenuloplanes nepalensis]|uniref:DNA-binding CsgD family transcriptional regulator n=1 Tax=Catenuloplanes nepalensis TaxID=587533 RepID=A0ABT9MWI1_9ACTN|nr:LuxR family transcriptional regulator [Catenuloplanes nepalensis]MDP9795588.1 DNA-binding CsgD family transcriptional regulator [Catenuloplanes nepalensis]